MSTATLTRASGLALLFGAVLFLFGSILSFAAAPLAPVWLVATATWMSGMVALLLGLPGVAVRQASRAGWAGFIGYVLVFLGWVLLTGFYLVDDLIMFTWLNALAPQVYVQWSFNPAVVASIHVGYSLLARGGALLGIATFRAGVLPRWAGALLIAAAVAALGSFVSGVLTVVAVVLVVLGLGWMGYVLWTAQREAIPQPALAA